MKVNLIYKKEFLIKGTKADFRKRVYAKLKQISNKERKKFGEVNIIFCDDDFIKSYNKKYLKHNYETDIITFGYDEGIETEGELLISVDTVLSNSKRFRTEFMDELERVIIHGILHLCGYEDRTRNLKKIMTGKENQYLK